MNFLSYRNDYKRRQNKILTTTYETYKKYQERLLTKNWQSCIRHVEEREEKWIEDRLRREKRMRLKEKLYAHENNIFVEEIQNQKSQPLRKIHAVE